MPEENKAWEENGFSGIDYRLVNPASGTWDEVQAIGQKFYLMVDLVFNHVVSQRVWFPDYLTGSPPARHYFIEMDLPGRSLSCGTTTKQSSLNTL